MFQLTLIHICPLAANVMYQSIPAIRGNTASADNDQTNGNPQSKGRESDLMDLMLST